MKGKAKNKKSPAKMQSKAQVMDTGIIEEYFYMIPSKVTVRDLAEALRSVPEEQKEIWTELDLMEIVLQTDSLIFENMLDTFTEEGDREFLEKRGIRQVYAASYNTLDKPAVKEILKELHAAFGGFMASDTEDLEPVFEVDAF